MRLLKSTGFILAVLCCSFTPLHHHQTDDATSTLNIDAQQNKGIVNPQIMGFNIVYCYEGDNVWQAGKGRVPNMLKAIGTHQLRYPGGTVVTKYHWEKPTGQGWSDEWSPDYKASKNTDPSTYMDIDEYLGVVKTQHTEPLVGINMGSGMKYNRVKEGVDEAIRLMKHCMASGVKVKYYYLDNEPYQHDANFTFTPEQYADAVNTYADAMRKVDPGIKIIVNTHPNLNNNAAYTKTLVTKAGRNIDMVDVHMYWKFKNATFENWEKEGVMKHQGAHPYNEQRAIFEKVFADAGYPNIKLVVLEWNVGPPGEGHITPTQSQAALMVSEQFTQYIQSGLFMSCFWPLSWPTKTDWTSRALLNAPAQYQPNKMYNMFSLYTDVLGQQKVSSTGSEKNLVNLAVKSTDGKTMWVYIINKKQESANISLNINLNGFKAKTFSAVGFNADDDSSASLAVHDVKLSQTDGAHYSIQIPKNSFAKLTFKL